MDLLANDLSVHQQFADTASFHDALSRLMAMRTIVQQHGLDLYCNRGFTSAQPIPDMPMQQATAHLSKDKRGALLRWLSQSGPFWDDMRKHDGDDYFECNGNVVTDTAVGEAAFRSLTGVDSGLVSLSPSAWEFSPVSVAWRRGAEGLDDATVKVKNWWDVGALNRDLEEIVPPITSWHELRDSAANRFKNLTFSTGCFSPLGGTPFAKASSDRLIFLLGILHQLAGEHDTNGHRSAAGHAIYQEHFTGNTAPFSDSSDSEKKEFRRALTFDDPDNPGHALFCPWHGKVPHMTLRLHFSWPITADKPVYIVYAGPKKTKR